MTLRKGNESEEKEQYHLDDPVADTTLYPTLLEGSSDTISPQHFLQHQRSIQPVFINHQESDYPMTRLILTHTLSHYLLKIFSHKLSNHQLAIPAIIPHNTIDLELTLHLINLIMVQSNPADIRENHDS
jgi:hypothetical protein